MEKHEIWRHLEDLLTSALQAEQQRLSSKDAFFIRDYIDHREYGLAYELLEHALRTGNIEPQDPTRSAMQSAAALMEL